MLHLRPVVSSLCYVPLRMVDVQSVMSQLRVRYERQDEDNHSEEFKGATEDDPQALEIKCYDLSKRGYIGVPRSYAINQLRIGSYVNLTTRPKRQPELFPRKIKPRDKEQQEFVDTLCALVREPPPVDIVANARTGTGKTVSALYVIENAIQAPTLIAVPTNYLLRQWRKRIEGFMGKAWLDKYVGHVQQNKMDYKGRLITMGIAASLSRRNYPEDLRRHFAAVIFDEWHMIGTPSMQGILAKYPASIRIGMTATNRRDTLLKVCSLHLGRPRVVSKQQVMRPHVYTIKHKTELPRGMKVASEHHVTTILARSKVRNARLARIIYERGYLRNRSVVALSDRTDQLQELITRCVDLGMPEDQCGLLVGEYREGRKKIKMSREVQDYVAENCQFIFATYGIFATGSDIDKLDMGVECTPRINLRQAIGRVLRIREGKQTPEWYSISDELWVYSELATVATLFAPPIEKVEYAQVTKDNEARQASFRDQQATVSELEI